MDLTQIKQVKEVSNIHEVNELIEGDWYVIKIYSPNPNQLIFIMGKP